MINVFSNTHNFKRILLYVLTDGKPNKMVDINYELPHEVFCNPGNCNDNMKGEYYQRFELEPNKYVFTMLFQFKEVKKVKEVEFSIRIGSTSKCKFEELKQENECLLRGLITWAVKYFLE